MPSFRYVSTDDNGKKYKGKIEANDEADLQQRLKTDGKYLVKSSVDRAGRGKHLKSAELSDFSRELGSLVGAGVSLARALTIISEEEATKPRLRAIYAELNRSVRRGTPLSQAMEEQGVFPPLIIYMLRSAEASGNLAATALQMGEHYQKDSKLASKIKSSTIYPKILAFLIVAAVTIIMGVVMPQFDDLFSQMESLPLPTRILFAISDFISTKWMILIPGVIIAIIAVKMICAIPQVKKGVDQIKLHIPVAGKLLKVIYTARFARTLSSLYSCGISIVNSLQIARSVIGNTYIESQFDSLITLVRGGQTLSEGVSRVDGFSKKLSSTIKVGEESGRLEELLFNIADTFDYDADMSINKLVALLEPVMIIIMAVVVAFVMFSVITPIYDSLGAIG